MEPRIWVNRNQPQTLYIAQLLLYFRGGVLLVFGLLLGAFLTVSSLVLAVGFVTAAYGIANERRWGYIVGVVVAALTLAGSLLEVIQDINNLSRTFSQLIGLLFDVALVALLLHPMSRNYQRYWPKRQRG
ncbi:MAG: hypothetical protein F4Z00_06265 [Acidimicrobiaceae bacterium]|nr:hypothetical protein [Acidimicrobiaceae bacterium]MCY3643235.1 hypothetical protein [Acidimicrobiaceae bacterium]MDE0492855.1 hypothetical protein [Acidimicrobiaceae bacterium]MDE0666260.1 hypothetical protein [Acidimicrobiaceae bacterium]MXW89630.1 hypothetical protein [Acidimicrobiaceae bacterium]